MNAMHAAEALLGILAANAAGVNAALAGSGVSVRLDPGIAPDDTSPYRYLKLGDRIKLADGLTVCFVPGSSPKVGYLASNTSEREVSVQIVAYLMNMHDPHGRELARGRIADALRSLYNRQAFREIPTGAGTLYNGEVGDEQFRYFEREAGSTRMGQIAAGVILPWTGLIYVQETQTSG